MYESSRYQTTDTRKRCIGAGPVIHSDGSALLADGSPKPRTDEIKYFVSNAPAKMPLKKMMTVGFARWHVEKWFERAKQEAGFGAFEVRTYTSLIRHWLCSRMAMYFLAAQTERLRGEKSANHPGACCGRSEHARMENMESMATFSDVRGPAMRVLSGA